MRIIAKNHDYYDKIVGFGHDQSVIYHRVPTSIPMSHLTAYPELNSGIAYDASLCETIKTKIASGRMVPDKHGEVPPDKFHVYTNRVDAYFKVVTVLFCGKLYGGVKVHLIASMATLDETVTFFDPQSMIDYLAKYKIGISFDDEKRNFAWYSSRGNRTWSEHFGLKGNSQHLDLAIKLKTPILVVEESDRRTEIIVTKDALLKEVDFFRIVDPFTAFQEIDMFLSGVLAPENRPMIEVDDKYKIMGHGFDKWSFRKPKAVK